MATEYSVLDIISWRSIIATGEAPREHGGSVLRSESSEDRQKMSIDGAWMMEGCSLKRGRIGRLFEDFLLIL